MKKRIAVLFSAVLFCICTMLGMVGCNAGNKGEFNENYPVTVTYYFNEGQINSYSQEKYLNVHYRANSYIVQPGAVTILPELQRGGYFVNGWYYAQTDGNGNVIKDENGYALASDRKFDFNSRVNQSIALVPGWTHKVNVVFKDNEQIAYSNGSETIYQSYNIVISQSDMLNKPSFEKTKRNARIKGYYWDEGLTQAVDFGENGLSVNALLDRLDGSAQEDESNNLVLTLYTKFYSVAATFIDPITNATYVIKVEAGEKLTVPENEEFFRGKSGYYLSYNWGNYSNELDLSNGATFYDLTQRMSSRPALSDDKESVVMEIYLK